MKLPHTRIIGPSLYYHRKVGGRIVQQRLGRLDEGEAVLRQRYAELLSPQPRTMADLMIAWQKEAHDLKPRTRAEYDRQIDVKLLRVFGPIPIDKLRPVHIGQYLEKRGNVSANREIACLSTVCEWGIRRGLMEYNPCRAVRRNKERPRKYYVTNKELGQALRKTTPEFRDFLLAAYFMGFRQGDLRTLQWGQANKKGIKLTEGKQQGRISMSLSAPLRALLTRAKARNEDGFIFVNTDGEPWGEWAIQSAMRRLEVPWTFHDLRAKAESDHKSGLGLLARYKRARQLEPVR